MTENTSKSFDFLIVDDDDEFRTSLVRALTRRGYSVCESASVVDAMLLLENVIPAKAIVDLRMPGESGVSLIRAMRKRLPETEIVMLTGYGSIATAVEAMQLGAMNYLTKPADVETILKAFEERHDGDTLRSDDVPSLKDVEWEHIQRVLRECDGNVSHAARLLGMHRRSLQRKLARES